MIGVTTQQFERAVLLMQEIPQGVERALSGAINRGLSTAKTTTSKEVRSIYHIRQGDLYQNVKTEKASVSAPIGAITFAGNVIPLVKFNTNDTSPVRAGVKKSSGAKNLPHAYKRDLGRYGEGIFEREYSFRESSKQLFGPSVAHMAKNPQVVDTVLNATQKMIDERLEHEFFRILSRYGV